MEYIICNTKVCFPSLKTWTIKCIFLNLFPFSKNVDYHMQFLEFHSLLQKRGLSYAISRISFPSPKMWTIICNIRNFFGSSKNVDSHMQFLKFLSILNIHGLLYAISR